MRNKALLFTILGCVGVTATALVAIRESKKTCEFLDRLYEDPKPLPKKVIRTVWDYKFTILSEALTTGSIIMSYKEQAKVIAGLTTTAAAAIASKEQILKAVRERLDDKTAREIEIDAIMRQQKFLPIRSIEDTSYGNTICCFTFCSRWFLSSEDAVREQLSIFNEDLVAEIKRDKYGGYRSLNDIFISLNMFTDDFGTFFGWSPEYIDPDEGIPFIIERVHEWHDELGEIHKCDVLLVKIDTDRGCSPFECFMEY